MISKKQGESHYHISINRPGMGSNIEASSDETVIQMQGWQNSLVMGRPDQLNSLIIGLPDYIQTMPIQGLMTPKP